MTRILIVDDDFEVLALLEDIVSSLGYEVRTTTSGEVAVALVHAFQPGVVLLDLVMPSPDGAEVLARLRRIDPELPVIMIAAQMTPDVAERLLAGGAFAYLEKPFVIGDVAALVRAALADRA